MKAVVEYSLSRTLNVGNYESTKIHVGLSMECDGARKEQVRRTFERVKKFVGDAIAKEEEDWRL